MGPLGLDDGSWKLSDITQFLWYPNKLYIILIASILDTYNSLDPQQESTFTVLYDGPDPSDSKQDSNGQEFSWIRSNVPSDSKKQFSNGVEELLPRKSNGLTNFKEQTKIQMAQNSHQSNCPTNFKEQTKIQMAQNSHQSNCPSDKWNKVQQNHNYILDCIYSIF